MQEDPYAYVLWLHIGNKVSKFPPQPAGTWVYLEENCPITLLKYNIKPIKINISGE